MIVVMLAGHTPGAACSAVWRSATENFVNDFTIFFFKDAATPEIYTLSLPDALPISVLLPLVSLARAVRVCEPAGTVTLALQVDRKSTRLNSSHDQISYAVFCLT